MDINITDVVKTTEGEYPVEMLLDSQVLVIGGYVIHHTEILQVRRAVEGEKFFLDYKILSFTGALHFTFDGKEWVQDED